MSFKPNSRFKKHYNEVYEQDPGAANLLLLLCELADEKGRVKIDEQELAELMAVRFEDLKEYAL